MGKRIFRIMPGLMGPGRSHQLEGHPLNRLTKKKEEKNEKSISSNYTTGSPSGLF